MGSVELGPVYSGTSARMTVAQHGKYSVFDLKWLSMIPVFLLPLHLLWFGIRFVWLASPIGIVLLGLVSWYSRLSVKTYSDLPSKNQFHKKLRKYTRGKKTNLFPMLILTIQAALYFYKQENYMGNTSNQTTCYRHISYKIAEKKLQDNLKLFAISKLNYRNGKSFYKILSLLAGDIEVNPGPSQPLCNVCTKPVNKRSLFCKCGIAYHKKCSPKVVSNISFKCTHCVGQSTATANTALKSCLLAKELPFNKVLNLDELSPHETNYTSTLADRLPDVNEWEIFKRKGMHFIHLNVNSLLPKIHEIRKIANRTKATIIGISETKLDETIYDNEVSIDGYTIIRKDRNRNGGGVCCYVLNDRNFNVRENFGSDFENIFLDILLPNSKPILIGILYRPPSQSGFLDNLSASISKSEKFDNQEVYILGDLNFNLLNVNGKYSFSNKKDAGTIPWLKEYIQFCTIHNLKQLIRTSTRTSKGTSTLLDHILTNTEELVLQYGVVNVGLSDHQMIYCTRKKQREKLNQHRTFNTRTYKNYTAEKFIDELNKIPFPDYLIFKDINEAFNDFSEKFVSLVNKIAPIKSFRVKGYTEDWFDGEINESIKDRDKLLRKYKKTKLETDYECYKAARNKSKNLIKSKKISFYEETIRENTGNSKKIWGTLKSLGLPNKKGNDSKICLKRDGKIIFEPKVNANILKEFYSNLAEDLVHKLPNPKGKFGKIYVKNYYKKLNIPTGSFSFSAVTEEYILDALKKTKTNKAAGMDGIPGIFFKDGASALSHPITQLVNLSISLGKVPDKTKIAKLKPLFKKGSKLETKNYRPVSLLPLLSKIYEKAINDQTHQFLAQKNILYCHQSGFRKFHSTDTCLSYLNDLILKGSDSGLLTGMILIDLQKAFDTIDHSILLEKMTHFGFSESVITWFRSYLDNRKFLVNIGKEYSEPGDLICGVPQGSILGPLLFLLYVNDMPGSVRCEILLYADDTCLIFQGKDTKEIERNLTTNFNALCDWFIDNKLSIHLGEEKTKSILFSGKQRPTNDILTIKHQDITLKQYKIVTYLGCLLDEKNSGESMALEVIKKINGKLKFLWRKQKFLNPCLRRLLCNALIQPHFDFAVSSWYPNLNKGFTDKLQICQNKCIRFCLGMGNRDHIGSIEFKKINWLPVQTRFEQCINVHVYKYINNESPVYMNEIFNIAEQPRIYTRANSGLNLIKPSRNKLSGRRAISYIGPRVWNPLPEDIKSALNANSFKHLIKTFYFDKIYQAENDNYIYY